MQLKFRLLILAQSYVNFIYKYKNWVFYHFEKLTKTRHLPLNVVNNKYNPVIEHSVFQMYCMTKLVQPLKITLCYQS
jgi:hypothetical protein